VRREVLEDVEGVVVGVVDVLEDEHDGAALGLTRRIGLEQALEHRDGAS